ncbi:hypothetical protein [Agrobacterium sp.]|uniref:hypothetical protein n=1 Tax=Agrobacterium sp. TaxID=361 RepID=UPI0028A8B04A|nr:hypothetical protein [Agrobacterium sp.]
MGEEDKCWRDPTSTEHALIMHLLRGDFRGKAQIVAQLASLQAMSIGQGVGLMLRTNGPLADVDNNDAPPADSNDRIVVEGFYDDQEPGHTGLFQVAALVRLALHVSNGRLSKLDIYKENGRAICTSPYEIDLSKVHFY